MPVDMGLAGDQWERYVYCRDNGHTDYVEKAVRCEAFVAGDQWQSEDLAKLRQSRRPAITINKLLAMVSTVLGEQLHNRTEVTFRPKAHVADELADAVAQLWLHIAENNQLSWLRSEVFCDGLITSRGFYDARLSFEDNMRGEVDLGQLNPKNVILDPDSEQYDPDKWADVFITKWMSPDEIEVLYNKDDADYLAHKNGSAFPYGADSVEMKRDSFGGKQAHTISNASMNTADMRIRKLVRVLDRQARRPFAAQFFVDPETGDMRQIPDNWDRNKIAHVVQTYGLAVIKKITNRVRWTVTADDVVLHDEWSPFERFTVVPYFPYYRHGRTIGIVENLLGPQELLNKTISQELHVINASANGGWKVKTGGLVNMNTAELESRGAETGLVLELTDLGDAEKIQPNQIPQGLDRLTYKAEEYMKGISNVSDSMMGMDREDVAAKAMQAKQMRGSMNQGKPLDNLARSDWMLARAVLGIVQRYYTEPRIYRIVRDSLTGETQDLGFNQVDEATGQIANDLTIGEYLISATLAPERANMEDTQFEQAKGLRELGVQIPDTVLVENSRLQRRGELIKTMTAASQSPEAQESQELDMRMKRATVAKEEAEVSNKQADAALRAARSGQIAQDAQKDQDPNGEMAMKMREMELEFAFKEKELAMEFAFKEKELAMKMQLDREIRTKEVEAKAMQARVDAARQASEPKPATKSDTL